MLYARIDLLIVRSFGVDFSNHPKMGISVGVEEAELQVEGWAGGWREGAGTIAGFEQRVAECNEVDMVPLVGGLAIHCRF